MNLTTLTQVAALAREVGVEPLRLVGLAPMLKLRADQLTTEHLLAIGDAIGMQVNASPETLEVVADFMTSKNASSIWDVLQTPENISAVIGFLNPKVAEDRNIIICPHCSGFIAP